MSQTEPDHVARARIKAREIAEEIAECADMEAAGLETEEARNRFWVLLAYRVAERCGIPEDDPKPSEPSDQPMSDEETRRFDLRELPFKIGNIPKGTRIKDVPLETLIWVDENPFRRELHRYLMSERIQREPQRVR